METLKELSSEELRSINGGNTLRDIGRAIGRWWGRAMETKCHCHYEDVPIMGDNFVS